MLQEECQQTEKEEQMEPLKPVRIGIRGIAGLLGLRLAHFINRLPGVELTFGIAKKDPTLQKLLALMNQSILTSNLPQKMYLAERQRCIKATNEEQSLIHFLPIDQLALRKSCDILIDTTSPGGKNELEDQIRSFPGWTILQSGEQPNGRLVVPPLFQKDSSSGRIIRQGDCIISGVAPVLACFQDLIAEVRMSVVMQYSKKLGDFPMSQRIHASYLNEEARTQIGDDLADLLPDSKTSVDSLIQIPGLDYYNVNLTICTTEPISGDDILARLSNRPRIMILPCTVTSTYGIDLMLREPARIQGQEIPPIGIYLPTIHPKGKEKANVVHLHLTLYSRLIAVLPNLDSIMIFGKKMKPLAAMRAVDQLLGFPQKK